LFALLKPNRAVVEFSRRLKETPEIFQPWKGTIYRVTTLKYRNPQIILLGEGSYRNGGRWNAIESFRAVYGSVDDVTALKESKANAEYAHLPYPFRETRLIVAVDVSLSRVVDLTASNTSKALDVTEEELRTEDWRKVQEQGFESLTQALGRAVFEARGEGLLAFSARVAKAINVAYFPENKLRGSEVRLCQPQELRNLELE
jgi:RES domain-containing protein